MIENLRLRTHVSPGSPRQVSRQLERRTSVFRTGKSSLCLRVVGSFVSGHGLPPLTCPLLRGYASHPHFRAIHKESVCKCLGIQGVSVCSPLESIKRHRNFSFSPAPGRQRTFHPRGGNLFHKGPAVSP